METNQLVNIAINAALLAGEKIMEVFTSNDFEIFIKADSSPLTLADRNAHILISSLLEPTQIPVMSEEGIHLPYAERVNWKTFWLVDPLDGTKEFISRNDEFTVNIALIYESISIAGVIYSPVSKELYIGIVGFGAWKIVDPEPHCTLDMIAQQGLKLPLDKTEGEFNVAASRSYFNDKTVAFIENLKKDHPQLKIIRKGSSLKFCLIAEGTVDIYPRFGPTMEWDTAAGHAIMKASGRNIYHIDQKTELHYNKENLLNPHFIAL